MIGIFLFNNNQELIKTISPNELIENTQDLELNGLITGSTAIKFNKEDKKIINSASYFGQKEDNNFWLYKIRTKQKDNGVVYISGVHILFDDLKGKIIRDMRPTNTTAVFAMNQMLKNTDWSIGYSNVSSIASSRFYYKTVLSCFTEVLKKWDCEFFPKITFSKGKIISKEIYLYDRIANDYGKWFEYGDKLVSVVAEENTDICTAFVGMGKGEEIFDENGDATGGYGRKIKFDKVEWSKDKGNPINKPLGQDYIEISEATKLFGYPDGSPKIGIVDFQDIEDRDELLKATYDYALENCRPKVHLKSKAVSKDPVELGEICAIIRPDLDIRYKTRVFKIRKDFLNPNLVEFEFGDKVSLSESDRIKQNEEDNKTKEDNLQSKLEQMLKSISDSYFNEDGYNYELKIGNNYNLPAGYYSFDKPIDQKPTKVVYMGAGKIIIANSKTPTGEWKWRTALTANGIAGEEIITNSITANKLKSDVGQSLDLSSNKTITLTGDTNIAGDFNVRGSNITLDGNVTMTSNFTVPNGNIGNLSANKITSGTIDADTITVKNLNADYITTGTVGVGVNNSSASLPSGSAGAQIHGGATDLNTNSSKFNFAYARNAFEVQGRINAMPEGNNHALELNGLTLNANGTSAGIKPWGGYIRCEGNSWHFQEIVVRSLYIGDKKIVLNADNNGIHYE